MTAHCIGWEVSCDGDGTRECPHSAAVRAQFTSRTAEEVRADGREQGWWYGKHGGKLTDRCPDCAAAAKQLRAQSRAQGRPSRAPEVLAAMLAEDPHPVYGAQLSAVLGAPSGTIHPLLDRLRKRGLVERRWEDDEETGGARRRLYWLTDAGADLARTIDTKETT